MSRAPVTPRSAGGAGATRPAKWLATREAGSVFGLRLVIGISAVFGRRVTRFFLRFVAFYYVALRPSVRRALRSYYAHLDGRPRRFWAMWRHVFAFAQVTLDRVFFLRGRSDLFEVTHSGDEHLVRLSESGRGGLLLSAHVGSQAAMNVDDAAARLRMNVAGYFKNARKLNDLLARINPASETRLIHIEPGAVGPVLALKELVDRGELVVLAADRTGVNDRTVEVDFMGARARLPKGPFILASVLRCPIYLTFALYHEPNRYALFCEPLSEQFAPPRAERDAAIAELAQRYAARLEHYCRLAPHNWFNFFDFWSAP